MSRRRQVMLHFLVALNLDHRQHRSVQYYAEKQNLTPRHFADIIKQESGYTPMEWINMVTINQAKNLLMNGHNISETARQLGFDYPHHFTRLFKNYVGITPSEYRGNGFRAK
jgi:AraC-like DNA-binding protein